MGLDIWFAEDIRNALLAANEASAATAAVISEVRGGASISASTASGEDSGPNPSTLRQAQDRTQGLGKAVTDSTELLAVSLRAYREGYKAALVTVALAFGITPQAITPRQAQAGALRRAQDEALRSLDDAQGSSFDELETMRAQEAIPQRGGEPQVTRPSPREGVEDSL
jgi:hypothetical protein